MPTGFLASKMAKVVATAVVVLALLAAIALGFGRVFTVIERLQDKAVKAAVAERDAHWTAQIEAANAKARAEREAQARRADQVSRQAAAEISRLSDSLAEKERRNAALPNADACGLDRDRVRLLTEGR